MSSMMWPGGGRCSARRIAKIEPSAPMTEPVRLSNALTRSSNRQ